MPSKFKFYFLDLAGFFFFFFDLQFVEFMDVKLTDTDDQLYINVLNLGEALWGSISKVLWIDFRNPWTFETV